MRPARRNPFPGLRPFDFEEYELFFGREEQYEQMISKLCATRFLAVVGTSGSGKSSLVRAGLLPALYGGQMIEIGSNWRVALFRPKDDPIRELALALNHRRVFGPEFKDNLSPLLSASDVTDWPSLCHRLSAEGQNGSPSPSRRIMELLPSEVQQEVLKVAAQSEVAQAGEGNGGRPSPTPSLINAFNEILQHSDFYHPQGFAGVIMPSEARQLLSRRQEGLTEREVETLNRLLLEASYPLEIAKNGELPKKITEVTLRRGDLGLVEAVRQAKMAEDENLLLVVDQFEELFRYARISKNGPHGNQAAAFVKLLLQAKSQTEIPIYVVITMRSDYLGDCAKFWDLPEAINEGQYLIPRLTREQRREAISGPVRMRGADITPQLINHLLNDMGDDPDQLPILQHALMRTWDKWEEDHEDGKPIDVRHYNAAGKMAEALSKHADEAYDELPDERARKLAEQLFKSLTERGVGENREIRRPTELRELRAITGAKVKELVKVIDVFRAEGRSFLLPSAAKPLARHTLIDISHESLIRNWTKLKNWVDEEAHSVNVYERLAETAKLSEQKRAGLLSDLEVEYALEWREKHKPNVAWASRYHASFNEDIQKVFKGVQTEEERKARDREVFESAMEFLDRSAEARRKEIEEKEAALQREIKEREDASRNEQRRLQMRRLAAVLSVAFLVSAVLAGIGLYQKEKIKEQSLANFHVIYGADINRAQRAFDSRYFAVTNQLLQDAQKVFENTSSPRGFEWYYLWATSHDELSTLIEEKDAAFSFVSQSDNDMLATLSGAATLRVWDMNKERVSLSLTPEGIHSVAFSQDGKWLAAGMKDGSVKLWDANTRSESIPMNGLAHGVSNLAFSPDGKSLVAVSFDATVKLYDTGARRTEVLSTHQDFHPEQTDAGGPGTPGSDLTRHRHSSIIAFSPDNRTVVIVTDGRGLQLIDVRTKSPLTIPFKQDVPITSVALSKNVLALGREDSKVVLWDISARGEAVTLLKHNQTITSLMFSRNGEMLASGSVDGRVAIWDMTKLPRPPSDEWLINNYKERVELDAEASDGEALDGGSPASGNSDGKLERERNRYNWDYSREILRVAYRGHSDAITSLTFSFDGTRLVSGSRDRSVKQWDAMKIRKEGRRRQPPPAADFDDGIHSLAFSPDGKMIAAGTRKGLVKIWDTEYEKLNPDNNRDPTWWPGHQENTISSLAFSSDNRTLATGSWDGMIKLWDVSTKRELLPLAGHEGKVMSVAFSSDGTLLASGGFDSTVRLWDVRAGKQLATLTDGGTTSHNEPVLSVAFSDQGGMLASVSADKTVKLWDVASRALRIPPLVNHADAVTSVAFSQDGLTLATGSFDRTVRLWNTSTGGQLAMLKAHSKPILAVGFSPDGRRLATGSEDGSMKIWDTSNELRETSTRRELITLREQSAVTAVAFSPVGDERVLAMSGAGNKVRLRFAATDQAVDAQRTPRFRS